MISKQVVVNFLLLFALLINSSFLMANTQEFQLEIGKIKIELPKDWENVKKFIGTDLMLIGPMKSDNRPVVVISGTEFSELSLDSDALKKNNLSYIEGREAWLIQHHAQSIEYFPYEFTTLKNGNQIHSLGHRYIIDTKEFTEKSYYILCRKKLFNFKFLVLSNEELENRPNINKILESFICE